MTKKIAPLVVLLLIGSTLVIGEVRYAAQIQPNGVRTLTQHLQRFGEPRLIYRIAHQDGPYYELQGFRGGKSPLFAFPSSEPAYIYDSKGQLIDWCSDPGDRPTHREKWPKLSETPVDILTFRTQFNL